MNLYWRIASYLIAIAAFVAAASWYGHTKYQAGYDQANLEANAAAAKISEQYRQAEQAAQKKANDEYAKYKDEQAKTLAANHDLANLYDSLQHDHAKLKRGASEAASNPKRAAAIGNAAIDNYQACRKEYIAMGSEYAGIAGQLNGLIAQCK